MLKDSNSHPESPKVAETVIEAGESRKPRIFLCHASEDKPEVEAIYDRLRDEGFVPWMDTIDLLPGQLWQQEISRVLPASDFVLVFLSQNSVAKRGYELSQ